MNRTADALDCFWNAAIDEVRNNQQAGFSENAVVAAIATGVAAVAQRLRETEGNAEYLAHLEAAVHDAGFEVKRAGPVTRIAPRDGKRAVLLTKDEHKELRECVEVMQLMLSPRLLPVLAHLLQVLDQ